MFVVVVATAAGAGVGFSRQACILLAIVLTLHRQRTVIAIMWCALARVIQIRRLSCDALGAAMSMNQLLQYVNKFRTHIGYSGTTVRIAFWSAPRW